MSLWVHRSSHATSENPKQIPAISQLPMTPRYNLFPALSGAVSGDFFAPLTSPMRDLRIGIFLPVFRAFGGLIFGSKQTLVSLPESVLSSRFLGWKIPDSDCSQLA
jgi:hypothetical protein